MLCLGSIEIDSVVSEPRYKWTILQRNYRKMTVEWNFSNYSFIKFHCEEILEPHNHVISKSVL